MKRIGGTKFVGGIVRDAPGRGEQESAAGRRRGRPQKGQSEMLTRAIVDIATELFLKDGYRATSMDAIAARTGSSKRTLYARFPSKLVLFEEVVYRFMHRHPPVVVDLSTADQSVDILLHKIARDLLEHAVNEASIAMFRLLIAEGYRLPELRVISREKLSEPTTRIIADFMTAAIERGEIADVDATLLAEQFIEAVVGHEVRRTAFGYVEPGLTPSRLARLTTAVDLFVRGIRTQGEDRAEDSELRPPKFGTGSR